MNIKELKEKINRLNSRINEFLDNLYVRLILGSLGFTLIVFSSISNLMDILLFNRIVFLTSQFMISFGIGLFGVALNMDGLKGKFVNVGIGLLVWLIGVFLTVDGIILFDTITIETNTIISGAGAFLLGSNLRQKAGKIKELAK